MSYRDAVGRTRRRTEWIDPLPIRRMEDLLDLPREESNGVVPAPWHWVYFFSESVPNRRVGADGHPLRGDFLPPIELPRRMFAGCEIRSHADLRTGRPATLVETIESIDEKQGAAGPLVFVAIEVAVQQDGADVLVEKRRLVYLDPGRRRIPLPEPRPFPDPDPGETALEWVPQHQELFRYSALTYNGHRIHYDADYARDVEGYPAVVVHGPLTATRLALLARRMTGAAVSALSVRGSAPLFVGQPVRLIGRAEGRGRVRLSAVRCDGTTAMEGWADAAG